MSSDNKNRSIAVYKLPSSRTHKITVTNWLYALNGAKDIEPKIALNLKIQKQNNTVNLKGFSAYDPSYYHSIERAHLKQVTVVQRIQQKTD